MRGLAALFLAASLGIAGWAGGTPGPILFADEPLVVAGGARPTLEFCGERVPLEWHREAGSGGGNWSASLPSDAPLGVWVVRAGGECFSFLRIPANWAIVELTGAGRAEIEAAGLTVLPVGGRVFVVGRAGDWLISYAFPGNRPRELRLSLSPHERRLIALGYVGLSLSTPVAMPGTDILLTATILSPIDIPSLSGALGLPPGWTAVPVSCETCPISSEEPIPAGVTATRAWRIHVPSSLEPGAYGISLSLPGTELADSATLEVARELPVEVVVAHWDVERNALDLTLPPEITYDQLLWATGLLGRKVPYSQDVMTADTLDELASLWRSGLTAP